MSAKITTELTELLGVPVEIEKVSVSWLNRLVLNGVYLEDQSGKTLFEANHVAAGFEILPILKGKFVFTTVRLFGFQLNLTKQTPDSPLNLQFVIDAFASQDTIPKERDIDLRFNSILIRRGDFTYNVLSEPETPEKFNPKHVGINNLSANISLKAFNKDSINANIKKISLEEKSGVALNKLSMNLIGNQDSAFIRNFEIRLPKTRLSIDRAHINWEQVDSLSQLLNEAPIRLDISPSQICLQDLSPFVPAFRNFTDTIDLVAQASGFINDIDLSRLTLNYGDKMEFNGKMALRGISHPEEAYIFGEISRMYITSEGLEGLVNNFNETYTPLPAMVRKLGTIHFSGEISGFFDNLVAYGRFYTAIGTIQTDILFGNNKQENIASYIRGEVSSTGLDLQQLFEEGNLYGIARFDLKLDASRPPNGYFSGKVEGHIAELDYKDYRYENIQLAGRFSHNGFNGSIAVDDPNGTLWAEGMFLDQGENSLFNFTANLKNFRPDLLNLTEAYESPDISFNLAADFRGNSIDNIEGSLYLDSLLFITEPSSFEVNELVVKANGHSEDRRLSIRSDIVNGEIRGAYSFSTFIPAILNTFKDYLPAIANIQVGKRPEDENNFTLALTIENTEPISETLKLPVTIVEQARITGNYNNLYDKFRLEAWFPQFRIQKTTLEGGYVRISNPGEEIELEVKAIQYNTKGLRNYLNFTANAHHNTIESLISWANNKERLFKADIASTAHFSEEINEKGDKTIHTDINLHSSPFIINDTIWQIHESLISLDNEAISIRNFMVSKGEEHLRLDGNISHNASDTLLLDLQGIELSYIFDILNIPALQFAGKATGLFHINDLYGSRMLNTDLEVKNFSFNQVELGQLNLFSEWDDIQQGILMLGTIYKNDSTWTDVNGYIFPVGTNAGLSLYFDANDIDVAFLQPFMQNVASNLQGKGSGEVHLHGPFNQLSIEGQAYVEDGGLGIDFLDTYYTFSDSVYLTTDGVRANNISVYDKYNHRGVVNLMVKYRYFKDIEFDVNIQTDNMLVYEADQRHNPLIYGQVFASGTGRIYGNERVVNLDINMQSDPNTKVTLNFMNASSAAEYDFITFIDKSVLSSVHDTLTMDSVYISPPLTEQGADIRMNLLLSVTPDANIEIIVDPVAGDKISARGSGNMQIEWNSRNDDIRLYGNYQILSGSYTFSLQQLVSRTFTIREGSTVTFQGDPFTAMLDIDAIYRVTADIRDLGSYFNEDLASYSVVVYCVLKLDGMLQNPTISFDIELPDTNEDVAQRIRSFIDTEDMMLRQIIYLLVINKFYTPDYSNTSGGGEFGAIAASALSSQLSTLLNTITDKVQIGTNIRTGQEGVTDTEVEMLLSSQLLNNRLIFNGNFGYRNTLNMGTTFIGEFDIEYLLTPSGEIRLKFYNHANDMYQYFKQSLTTQGLGIMYRKDFTRFSEIFQRRRRILLPPADTTPVIQEEGEEGEREPLIEEILIIEE